MTARQNIRAAEEMIELRAERGNKCYFCSKDGDLEFMHIKPTRLGGGGGNPSRGRGRKERIADIRAHPDCYLLACHPCHRKYDAEKNESPLGLY